MPGSEPGLHPRGCPRWRRLTDEWTGAQTPLCAQKKVVHFIAAAIRRITQLMRASPCSRFADSSSLTRSSRKNLGFFGPALHSPSLDRTASHTASARWSCTVRVGTRVRVNNSLQCSLASQQRSPTRSCVMHVAPSCSSVRTTAVLMYVDSSMSTHIRDVRSLVVWNVALHP